MIKFDKDVLSALHKLESEGFETYAAGTCVRESLAGATVYDWDLITRAGIDDMKRLFPDSLVLSQARQIIRVDYTYEVERKDEDDNVTTNLEGAVLDIRNFEGEVEEFLRKQGFTIDAMADNPERSFIDPFEGREDIKKKLIRTIKDPDELFKAEPIRMLQAVRMAAELDFDLHKSVFDAITVNWRRLADHDADEIRPEFEMLLTADNAGKGLNMLAGTGLMPVIIGEDLARHMKSGEMKNFLKLCENIDKTMPVRMRRLGLFYTIFDKKRGLEAIERMKFDEESRGLLKDAMLEFINIQFLGDIKQFKKYVSELGMERYDYLHNLNKAQRIVYEQEVTKVDSRNYYMKEIVTNKEPLFAEDLCIDINDIMEAGITDDPEKAESILFMCLAPVHDDPKNNDRTYLLKMAKKYSKSKLASSTRYVTWLK